MPLFGPPDLKKLEARQDIPGSNRVLKVHLNRADKDKYEQFRRSACAALARLGLPAVEPLIVELTLGENEVSPLASSALRQIGSPAVPQLVNAMLNSLGKNIYVTTGSPGSWVRSATNASLSR